MHHRCTRCQRVILWWRRFSVHSYRSLEPERNTATLNFSQAIGFLNSKCENDIYISMHGSVKKNKKLVKNRELGKFLEK